MGPALADTSVFVAREAGRSLAAPVPDRIAVSVVTLAELRLGVLIATDVDRPQRMVTLRLAESFEAFDIDDEVAWRWARLRTSLRKVGRRMPINDSWIAATAIANGLAVVTQDADYRDVPGLTVIEL